MAIPPYLQGMQFEIPSGWVPETADSVESSVYYAFPCTYLDYGTLNLYIKHSKRLTTTNNKIETL